MTYETDAVKIVAELMALSARTAPKARGTDSIVVNVVADGDLKALAEELRRISGSFGFKFFLRDAGNIEQSDACVLIGSQGVDIVGLNCGACGYETCQEMPKAQKDRADRNSKSQEKPFHGPNCAIRMTDLGIALGSAAKTAEIHNVDNRIMFSAGVGALSLGWMKGCNVAYGIPLRASGKSIYFDRPV